MFDHLKRFGTRKSRIAPPDFVQESSTRTLVGQNERIENYTILRPLGRGGMAEVYLARGDASNDLVVLKRILPEYVTDEAIRDRFVDEANLLSRLSHPNIGRMFHLGASGDELFMAMEFLRGVDLKQLTEEVPTRTRLPLEAPDTQAKPNAIPLECALAIVVGIADGLHYAHEQKDELGVPLGVVHRDVSPHNIMLTFQGIPKLIDFGIASVSMKKSETYQGAVVGKLQYLSPEQCLSRPVDRRSDVFSLAIVLYELTTGVVLYAGASALEVMKKIVDDEAPRPSSFRYGYFPELERIVMKGLERNPADRYQSTRELKNDLLNFCYAHDVTINAATLANFMRDLYPEQSKIDSLSDDDWLNSSARAAEARRKPGKKSEPGLITATRDRIALEVRTDVTSLHRIKVPSRKKWFIGFGLGAAGAALVGLALTFAMSTGTNAENSAPASNPQLEAELRSADEHLANGRLVGPGESALSRLLAAKAIAPNDLGVTQRLAALADKFEELADDAYRAGSLPEAAAHLQAALNADPQREAARTKMLEIEETVKRQQR